MAGSSGRSRDDEEPTGREAVEVSASGPAREERVALQLLSELGARDVAEINLDEGRVALENHQSIRANLVFANRAPKLLLEPPTRTTALLESNSRIGD